MTVLILSILLLILAALAGGAFVYRRVRGSGTTSPVNARFVRYQLAQHQGHVARDFGRGGGIDCPDGEGLLREALEFALDALASDDPGQILSALETIRLCVPQLAPASRSESVRVIATAIASFPPPATLPALARTMRELVGPPADFPQRTRLELSTDEQEGSAGSRETVGKTPWDLLDRLTSSYARTALLLLIIMGTFVVLGLTLKVQYRSEGLDLAFGGGFQKEAIPASAAAELEGILRPNLDAVRWPDILADSTIHVWILRQQPEAAGSDTAWAPVQLAWKRFGCEPTRDARLCRAVERAAAAIRKSLPTSISAISFDLHLVSGGALRSVAPICNIKAYTWGLWGLASTDGPRAPNTEQRHAPLSLDPLPVGDMR